MNSDFESPRRFDGISVADAKNETIFEVTVPHFLECGLVGREIAYVEAWLDGVKLNSTNETYQSKSDDEVSVAVAKRTDAACQKTTPLILNDELTCNTPDFSIRVHNEGLDKRGTHLNFKFTKVPSTDFLSGPLAELIWSGNKELSMAAREMKMKEHVFAGSKS